ncbi:MAG: hypothetical protein WCO35_01285 [Candidatus Nomurabacteria bacterium]
MYKLSSIFSSILLFSIFLILYLCYLDIENKNIFICIFLLLCLVFFLLKIIYSFVGFFNPNIGLIKKVKEEIDFDEDYLRFTKFALEDRNWNPEEIKRELNIQKGKLEKKKRLLVVLKMK